MNKKKKIAFGKYILLLIFVLVSIYAVMLLPTIMESNMPKVNTVFAAFTSYSPCVRCEGRIEYGETMSVTTDVPVIIEKFYVFGGDRVDAGQVVATVNKEKTIQALYAMYNEYPDISVPSDPSALIPETVEAQYSGVICETAEAGTLIAAGESIARIGEKGSLVMKAAVEEKDISKVCIDQSAVITLAANERTYNGTVKHISETAKKVYSGTVEEVVVEVELSIDDDDGLRSGYTAKAEITVGEDKQLLTLPYSAVCQDDDGEYVYVFESGVAVRKDITTGIELANRTEVFGISRFDEIILNAGGIDAENYVIRNESENSDSL